MSGVKVSNKCNKPCVACGVAVSVGSRTSNSRVLCEPHKKERRREANRRAQRRYQDKRLAKGLTALPQHERKKTCLSCDTVFTTVSRTTRCCSRSCASSLAEKSKSSRVYTKPCVDCGAAVSVASSTQNARCPKDKKAYQDRQKDRAATSRRNAKKVEYGKGPYKSYAVYGPTWATREGKYGWRVIARHRGCSSTREMSLAHYTLSVALGRRVRDQEDIVFIDGNVDNCSLENLRLSS